MFKLKHDYHNHSFSSTCDKNFYKSTLTTVKYNLSSCSDIL